MSPSPLRYELLQTLCIADKLNFLHFIEKICKQHHIRDLLKSESETKLCDGTESNTEEEPKSKDPIPPKSGIKLLEEGLERIGLQTQGTSESEETSGSEACLAKASSCDEEGDGEGENGGKDTKGTVNEVKRIRQVFGKCEDKILLYGMGAGKFKW